MEKNTEVKTNVNINGELPDVDGIVCQLLSHISTIIAVLLLGCILLCAIRWAILKDASTNTIAIIMGVAAVTSVGIASYSAYRILSSIKDLKWTITVQCPGSSSKEESSSNPSTQQGQARNAQTNKKKGA